MTSDRHHLTLPGGDLHVRVDGPRDAPALLLIHGAGASGRSWDPLVPLLDKEHRVLRIDLLGHGASATPDGPGYAITEQADRMAAALDLLGVQRVVVAGHSTGGSVATALAERRGDLVRALVLVNVGPGMAALIAPEIAIGPQQWAALTDEQIRHAMRPAFSLPGFRIPQELVDDVRGMTHHAFTATMRAPRDYLPRRTLPDRLATLGFPLLVLAGADDRRWRSAAAADYRVVPGARIELLPGLGHSPMLEDPARTAVPLLDFLATLGG